jgi:poly(3-hydroxybutyrate) depolymerase
LVLTPRVTLSQMADSVLADLNRHMAAQVDQLGNLVGGNEAAAEAHRRRYAELLLVIEGDRDGSCPPGQGRAAIRLCTGLDAAMKRHHLQPGAGHETLFEGPVWEAQIYPLVRDLIRDKA